jgi:N-acetylglucosaminyl-diphospho-decaprenol L-rhamnosyltransferase
MILSIVIINWNSKDYLRECLNSIVQGTKHLDYEILVIDNASHDGSAQMVAAEYSSVKFIQSERNLGFSGGNNCAAQRATGDFLLFLNPDTMVEGDALVELVEALRHQPDAAIAGARLLNSDRTLQTSCVQSFPTVANQFLDCEWLRRRFPRSSLWGMMALFDDPREPVPVDAVSGACLMIRREMFKRVGGFDESYFMYSEDIDLCFKVHQAGSRIVYVHDATVIHHGGGSSRQSRNAFSNVMLRESVYRFFRQHRGRYVANSFRFFIGLDAMLRLPVATAHWLLSRGTAAKAPVTKWISIFRWSVGLESWSARQ